MITQFRSFLALLALLFCTSSLLALEAPVSLSTLAEKSERIIRGKVTRITYTQETNRFGDELIYTHASIRVAESLKGDRSDVVVKVEGGTFHGITLEVSDAAEFRTGEDVVVFLKKDLAEFTPVGGLQSKYTITNGGKIMENGRQYSMLRTEILRAVKERKVQQ